jgi:hypothetical protein
MPSSQKLDKMCVKEIISNNEAQDNRLLLHL